MPQPKKDLSAVIFLVSLPVLLAGCHTPPEDSRADILDSVFSGTEAGWIDMSYPYDETTIFWPTAQPFELEVVAAGPTSAGYYYGANNFRMAEHGGTHLDAPIHFAEGGDTTEQIPLGRLIGPAVVVDVSAAASLDADYQVSVLDLISWEASHGTIPEQAILLIRTGWGAGWPDRQAYLGTALTGEPALSELHFPGLSADAAGWLVHNRKLDAIGIDTASIDHGQSTLFEAHRILMEANIPAFENVASLDQLPATGAYVIALPTKIGKGTGGPLRMVGLIPRMREVAPQFRTPVGNRR